MGERMQGAAMALADAVTAVLPYGRPTRAAARKCRIIAHRGEHDNRRLLENTVPAFEAARRAGVWGIECDIRWTADDEPVVHHDPTVERLFGLPRAIAELELAELRRRLPVIPTLAEVVRRFGGRMHLMLELKAGSGLELPARQRALERQLRGLVPGEDYHLLALDPALLRQAGFVPPAARWLVAGTRVGPLLDVCLEEGWGGLCGHYLLMTRAVTRRLEEAGRGCGTGYVGSRGCLQREISRGIPWLFSNHAAAMQSALLDLQR